MTFFDEIGRKITQTGQEAYSKTKDMAEFVRYNSIISEEEKLLSKYYESLGRAYYNKIIQQSDAINDFSEITNSILNSLSKISEFQERIKQLKGIKKCTNCGADVPNGAAFCIKCGTKVVSDLGACCKKCGAKLPENASFCTSCGSKISTLTIDEQNEILDNSIVRCDNCGEPIEEGVLFCTNCGIKVEKAELVIEIKANNDTNPKDTVVENLDEITQNTVVENDECKCPNCKANIEDEDVFCTNCGHKLNNEED